eukprot:jgi/Chlat1/4657/Chrsp3S00436
MGNAIRKALDRLVWGNKEMRVVMLGLDAAGKTTILYKLHIGEVLSTDRVTRAAAEFQTIISDPLMRHAAILVFANKQDLKGALSTAEVCEALGLTGQLGRGRKWHVQGAVATQGEGLYEGLDWLASTLKSVLASGGSTAVNALGR